MGSHGVGRFVAEDSLTYEERFGPFARRILRAFRWLTWIAKGLSRQPRTILVEIRWRLGDEVMALPIYSALAKVYPRDRVHVWSTYPELLDDNPSVESVNQSLPRIDRYICLRDAPRDLLRIERYAMLAQVDVPPTAPRFYCHDWQLRDVESMPSGDRPVVAVSIGASWPTKRWPREKWTALVEALLAQGYRVAVVGGADESLGLGVDYTGRTSIHDLAVTLREAAVLVCNDSGPMHVALAVGTPAVALFGPTDPSILVHSDSGLVVVDNERECKGCWNISQAMREPGVCPLNIEPCLGTIEVDTVLARVDAILAAER
jgi:ADP-heptose:LPS heptosyltransferase